MRFVLQAVKASAPSATQSAQPVVSHPATTCAAQQPQPRRQSDTSTASKQPLSTSKTAAPTSSFAAIATATKFAPPLLVSPAATATLEEEKHAVNEVRLRFDTTYSEVVDSSSGRYVADEHDSDDEQQGEYSDDEDDAAEQGVPSVAINCSYSVNPTSTLQRSQHCSQVDDGDEQTIEEEEQEDVGQQQQEEAETYQEDDEEELSGQDEQPGEAEQAEETDEAEEAEEEDEVEAEQEELHHFVAVDASVTHIEHSKTAPVDGSDDVSNDSDNELYEADEHAVQLHAFQPHAIHVQPTTPHEDEKEEEEDTAVEDETEQTDVMEQTGDDVEEGEDGVSELCTVQIHQHSLVTQGGSSHSHWHTVDTPTRARHSGAYSTHATPTPGTPHTRTASFTLNDSADDIPPAPPGTPSRCEAVEQWSEALHEARVAALQVELKERVEARRRRLRRASYMEEMEERRLQKELDAKQRALTQLRLLRVKQEAQEKLAALARQKQQEAEEREQRERRDKENQQQQPPTQPAPQLQKRRSTSANQNRQPAHTRTPSSLVLRKRIRQARYDRLLKAVERGDTFTKYYDSWYSKPKPKFVRVVCVAPTTPAAASSSSTSMKLTWGSSMFSMDKGLDLSSVVKVQRGSECSIAGKLPVQLHSRAFSISTREGRTLHLVAPTQATREVWLSFVLLVTERNRQPLGELNGVPTSEVRAGEDTRASAGNAAGGGVGERVRKSVGARLSVGRLSLGLLSLGGKTIN